MKRASEAELAGQDAMHKAKAYYKEMEQEKVAAVEHLDALKNEFKQKSEAVDKLSRELELQKSEITNILNEKNALQKDLDLERRTSQTAQYDLKESKHRSEDFLRQIADLRNQLEKAEANATQQKVSETTESEKAQHLAKAKEDSTTILMLQKEVAEANEVIEELRDALKNAVTGNSQETRIDGGPSTDRGEGAPLFYAIEKQAELNTARNEINRLASLYADVQSEKVEAEEALEEMRHQMEEARAKLERFEKLGPSTHDAGVASASREGADGKAVESDSGRMNIEYLKNIMLSFLNAKTLAEKKALVPVIGAVLCLTPDEQAKAIKNVEATGGIEGVSSALFESIGTRVHRII